MSGEALCDTCGGTCAGGVRFYDAGDTERVGCTDNASCFTVFTGRTAQERRLIRACRAAGRYLERARTEHADGP